MPGVEPFFDTNILVYAFSAKERRQPVALGLLLAGGTVGVQTLNEFVNVAGRKMKAPWPDTIGWLDTIIELCLPPVSMTLDVHRRGIRISHKYGYHIYDSMMLAAALEASCTVFYSEDMQDGQTIDGMTIRNPFAKQ
jgi:predicted nucleic acid-binding protein